MQRLFSGLTTAWLVVCIPSLIVWGLVIRASDQGVDRFRAVWDWLSDKLAYPLLLRPLADPAWRWLNDGTALTATFGFVILIACWALILTVPPVLFLFWWRVIASRLGGTSYTDSADSSPLAPLYIITLPLALLWAAILRIFGHPRRLILGSLIAFTIGFGIATTVMAIKFETGGSERYETTVFITEKMWNGYLTTAHVPHLFDAKHERASREMRQAVLLKAEREWFAYMDHWFQDDGLRTIVWTTASRHGLVAVGLYGCLLLLRGLFSLGDD